MSAHDFIPNWPAIWSVLHTLCNLCQVLGDRSCLSVSMAEDSTSGVPRNFFPGGGDSTNSVEDRRQRERGSGGGSPLVRGSGGSCNLIQEISFHIVRFS